MATKSSDDQSNGHRTTHYNDVVQVASELQCQGVLCTARAQDYPTHTAGGLLVEGWCIATASNKTKGIALIIAS